MVDAEQGVVLPGFVDPHTHLVFAGERAAEWEARMQGASYLELLRARRRDSDDGRAQRARQASSCCSRARERWARRCLKHGTTTLEIKSGYCLDRAGELKLLEVARMLKARLPLEIVPTFLGAHVVPPEYRAEREAYLELVEATQTEVAARGLAEFADVFCETEAFTLDESERLLQHARALGLGVKLHAEQFSSLGRGGVGTRARREQRRPSGVHFRRGSRAALAARRTAGRRAPCRASPSTWRSIVTRRHDG